MPYQSMKGIAFSRASRLTLRASKVLRQLVLDQDPLIFKLFVTPVTELCVGLDNGAFLASAHCLLTGWEVVELGMVN